jgi:hypothetical protein
VSGKARSQMPADELQSSAVFGKARSQTPAYELQCSAVNGKARLPTPDNELLYYVLLYIPESCRFFLR